MSTPASDGATVWLRIDDEVMHLTADATEPLALQLPLGAERTAREFFRHAPPAPLELEHAIEAVEDAVMPVRSQLPAQARLVSRDPALWVLARHAGVADKSPAWLGLDAVEQLFNRLADRSAGRPATQDTLPVDGASAARLLILREALHHWGRDGITLAA